MKTIACWFLVQTLASVLMAVPARSESPCIVAFYNAPGSDDLQPQNLPATTSSTDDADPSQLFERVVEISGVLRVEAFAVAGLNNACAASIDGKRIVYYDRDWLLSYSGGDKWVQIGILAHELGHIVHGHGKNDGLDLWRREYEADRYAGRIIATLGGSEEDVKRVAANGAPDASAGYPSRALRVAAFIEGYELGASTKSPSQTSPSTESSSSASLGERLAGIDVLYFERSQDGGLVDGLLDRSGVSYRTQSSTKNAPSNVVTCTDDISFDSVKQITIELVRAGVPIRLIAPQWHQVTNRITIENLNFADRYKLLTENTINRMKACPKRSDFYSSPAQNDAPILEPQVVVVPN